ncbi:MAG: hypothetical protein FWG90_04915 [Oscillospiraceae bacterium]|nr:hypothetical protein [Oscillospiraceae bacterium]
MGTRESAEFATRLWREAVKKKADVIKLANMMINKKLEWREDKPVGLIIERFCTKLK